MSRLGRHSLSSAEATAAGAWSAVSQLGSAISNSQLVQKIKRAASQPALAGPSTSSFADAADAVLRGPTTSSGEGGGGGGSSSRMLPPVAPRKDSKRD
jgi:hypothetical protein